MTLALNVKPIKYIFILLQTVMYVRGWTWYDAMNYNISLTQLV